MWSRLTRGTGCTARWATRSGCVIVFDHFQIIKLILGSLLVVVLGWIGHSGGSLGMARWRKQAQNEQETRRQEEQ